ncbi:hypothetical protein SCUP234_08051 [Seiridium cupressi]|uniref:Uncharacterized protein n=1 Tax=Seiridium unicorne TaxID=138068 RepID=A0ABR2V0A6_9PEZI
MSTVEIKRRASEQCEAVGVGRSVEDERFYSTRGKEMMIVVRAGADDDWKVWWRCGEESFWATLAGLGGRWRLVLVGDGAGAGAGGGGGAGLKEGRWRTNNTA